LVIAGEHDPVTAASHGRTIAETIPGAQFTVLPTVHLPNVEMPKEYIETVLTFLRAGDV
jgi:3-oxoadipate enol-lactonase